MDWRLCKTEHTYSQYIINTYATNLSCLQHKPFLSVTTAPLTFSSHKKRFHLIITFICQQTATESRAHINAEQFETADIQIKYSICSKDIKSIQYL